jgi:hypothetical protein
MATAGDINIRAMKTARANSTGMPSPPDTQRCVLTLRHRDGATVELPREFPVYFHLLVAGGRRFASVE